MGFSSIEECEVPDRIFYTAATDKDNKDKITGYVPSKFLVRNGAYVVDPVPGASQNANLYSDSAGNNQTDGKIANPNNYVVVPANYTEQSARDAAAALEKFNRLPLPGATLGLMTTDFWPGGSEELQRNPRWGIPPNSFVRGYTSAASDHFGYVTGAAGLPRGLAELGGGIHNILSKVRGSHVDVTGKAGLSKINEANIAQGYAAGAASRQPPSPFNNYGYGEKLNDQPNAIGDGNGIAPFAATVGGVNSDEPVPPSWPPGQTAPVRYLGTRLRY
jgi:hypothetical protein